MQTRVVGVSVPRKEGVPKLTGQARYIDDLSLPGMIFGATVRSTIARGAIETIKFGEGVAWHEFTIVTAKDIPGRNVVSLIMTTSPAWRMVWSIIPKRRSFCLRTPIAMPWQPPWRQ